MWVEQILRRGFDVTHDAGGRPVDFLDLSWDECRRVVKKTTRGGEPVRVLLPAGEAVRHGDVLREDASGWVVVNVLACGVVVVTPGSVNEAAELGLRLGNLHLPVQVTSAGEMVFVEDETALSAVRAVGTTWRLEQRVFEPMPIDAGHVTVGSGFAVVRSGNAETPR